MQDDSTRRLLEENVRLNRENNKILRSLKRAQTIGTILRILWIAILIGIPVVLYVYVLQPYYETARTQYEEFEQQAGEIPFLNLFFEDKKSQ